MPKWIIRMLIIGGWAAIVTVSTAAVVQVVTEKISLPLHVHLVCAGLGVFALMLMAILAIMTPKIWNMEIKI